MYKKITILAFIILFSIDLVSQILPPNKNKFMTGALVSDLVITGKKLGKKYIYMAYIKPKDKMNNIIAYFLPHSGELDLIKKKRILRKEILVKYIVRNDSILVNNIY